MLLAQTTWWAALLAAIVVGGIALAGQQILQELGLLHRFAENLWKEKIALYQSVADKAYLLMRRMYLDDNEILDPKTKMTAALMSEFGRLRAIGASPVIMATTDFLKAIQSAAKDVKDAKKVSANSSTLMKEKYDGLVAAIRADLSVDPLSDKARDFMPRLPQELYGGADN